MRFVFHSYLQAHAQLEKSMDSTMEATFQDHLVVPHFLGNLWCDSFGYEDRSPNDPLSIL